MHARSNSHRLIVLVRSPRPLAPAVLVVLALVSASVHAAPTRLRPVQSSAPDSVSAPPVNDLCSGAIAIPGNGPFPHYTTAVNVFLASTVGDPPRPLEFPFTSLTRSTWYSITPSVSGRYVFSACTSQD